MATQNYWALGFPAEIPATVVFVLFCFVLFVLFCFLGVSVALTGQQLSMDQVDLKLTNIHLPLSP